jgi:2-C-methyl-D-erythritol 4-phosphate cytidylyltransferase/2-C-methyl-D-erythritol 2,4-cyclodiphosphate synthase
MNPGAKTVALVVAAGSGSRAGGAIPKQYRPLVGRPLLAHTLDALLHPAINEIRVVISEGHEDLYRNAIGERPLPCPVIGGASRQQSVRNGLAALTGQGVERILIHDAARPFVSGHVVDRLLDALDTTAGAIPVLPVVDTLAMGESRLGEVVPREGLVRVQTPQAFRFGEIVRAHAAWNGPDATDDAQVARAAGLEVALVAGDESLEKLTYEADFERAERRVFGPMTSRTGLGFDVHAFAGGEELWLGGVQIPHERGLKGHSDADVVLHALTDALLGAIGAGDIGDHFPPTEPKWRGAPSSLFVEHARELVEHAGARIDHVDITIICEAPRIGPHREPMRARVAALLRLQIGAVSIKATTTEGLGFTGRGEGIAAQALASISMRATS